MNTYCENKGVGIYAVLAVIVTIMTMRGRSISSANSYFDNNGELYMQC